MDFYQIKERINKRDNVEIYPDFKVCRSKDLMVRGRSFYAIWDEAKGLWSTDEYDVQRLVDNELIEYKKEKEKKTDAKVTIRSMSDFSSKSWGEFRSYLAHVSDNSHPLDNKLTFSNTEVKKKDYVSKKLSYPLERGTIDAFDEIIGTLYTPDERQKIEWAIGSIIAGDSKDIQKFVVLYGEAGTGKSTILNIIQKLFEGYYTMFEAKALASSNNSFATEAFKNNSLVAIQHDGDLSKIEDNTTLNSIISHEEMRINEKYKPSYTSRINCFLFMGTNKPVKITDAKSGIIRRLIDVRPTGTKIGPKRYQALMTQIDFELGAIAHHCLDVYRELGKNYYNAYQPIYMMLQTDAFFNFIEANYWVFKEANGVSLSHAYDMYKAYCEESLMDFKMPRHKFRDELRNYFRNFDEITRIDGMQIRSYYSGFRANKFDKNDKEKESHQSSLVLDQDVSLLDDLLKGRPAQYAGLNETPINKWVKVETKLEDLNTRKLHYVKPPDNHIVIDFDLREDGKKSVEQNIEAASKWPSTYAEFSKSGSGIHLHYLYDGDVTKLSRVYSDGIEVKVFVGDGSLRRKLTKCNNVPVAVINSGLPLKGDKMINLEVVKSEKSLRNMIKRNLHKEIHPGTKPSMDFIYKILDDAYNSGMKYDVTDMRPAILTFANGSTNQSSYCVKLVSQMQFKSEETSVDNAEYKSDELVFFDVEVFPNLFVVVWKMEGKPAVKMINPSSTDIERLFDFKLVGFNNRRYDNHILYARYIGYDNERLYKLSQRIINDDKNGLFGEAYNISYTDIYDFASATNKKSLKKWEIELGIHHQELGLPWDQPVQKALWDKVADYCLNDVIATEVLFNHLKGDWTARQILAEITGLTVNDTTNTLTTKLVFGDAKNPQKEAIYTDLSIMFPGYKFENGKSEYLGEDPSEGGYVYAIPGMYKNVPVLDVGAMHPTSIEQLNLFGPYTKRYSELKRGRIFIKHKDYTSLGDILDGKLVPFISRIESGEISPKDLSNALKTALNSAYGLTSAKFDNKFRDPRNVDNIVAKRGALFMIDLKRSVQLQGYNVVHIKTDSIKVSDAPQKAIDFIMEFGKKYGYEFEHEETYDKMCLINNAVYIARQRSDGKWSATGAQFAHPYVFKTMFSKESIKFEDLCETKSVTSQMYLDMNEGMEEGEHNYHFVGRVGSFYPIRPGLGGGLLLREKDGKYYAVGGTKEYRWLEAEMVKALGKENDIDMSYFDSLVSDAVEVLGKFGDVQWFLSDEPVMDDNESVAPWNVPCGTKLYENCIQCMNYDNANSETCKMGYKIIPF